LNPAPGVNIAELSAGSEFRRKMSDASNRLSRQSRRFPVLNPRARMEQYSNIRSENKLK
jgi:hypothetical protein